MRTATCHRLVCFNGGAKVRRFILAEESPFFEAKFRSAEFAQSNGTVDLSELDGHILQVAASVQQLCCRVQFSL